MDDGGMMRDDLYMKPKSGESPGLLRHGFTRRRRLPLACALLATVLHTAGARADDAATPLFSYSGFGTVGVVHSSEDKADFTSSIFNPNGAGYSRAWSADVDSLLAGQVTATFTPQLSAVLQMMSEQNYDNTYRPHMEWGNVKYQFTPDLFVRAGRVVMPSFMNSEYRNVGYASIWVRPPLEVYSLVPITVNDGGDASYRMHFGDVADTVHVIYGGLDSTTPAGGHARAWNQWGVFDTLEYGPWTLRIAYHQAHLNLDSLRSFFDAFRQFGPGGTAIADKYDCDGKLIPLGSVGASYDPGRWILMAEWATSNSHCFIGAQTGWYAGGSYRFGKLSPYITYAQLKADSSTSTAGLSLQALPPSAVGPAAGLNAGLNGILGSIPVQKTVSIGARWDFAKNIDLKLQFDHTMLGAGSPGLLINVQPGFQPGGSVNLFSATVDFVF
jgi:hypothetical protein